MADFGISEGLAALGSWLTSDTVVSAAATGVASAGVAAALQPKAPGIKAPVAMPDQQIVADARRRSLVQQLARRGRASTILSDSDNTLG